MRALVVAISAGCFSPHPPDGAPCGDGSACPDPLQCYFGACFAEPPPCTPIDGGSGRLTAPAVTSPIVVDGDLSDWPTCFVTVDAANAGEVRDLGAGGMFPSGKFSIATDPGGNHLYVAAQVDGVGPLGDQPPPEVYLNNAIWVYCAAGVLPATATYDTASAQIVVDHANQEQAFRSGDTLALPAVVTAAVTTGSQFAIELEVEPSSFGVGAFASSIGFDIGIVGGDGSVMTSELVWFQRCTLPACGCTNGSAAPFCDAREFGTAVIAP